MGKAWVVAGVVIDHEVPVSAGDDSVLFPVWAGASTATVLGSGSLLTVTSVIRAYCGEDGWLICSDDTVLSVASGMVIVLPIAWPKGVTHAVSGLPSVAAQPPIAGTPVRRRLAVVPFQPISVAMTES